ncbi:MAG: hypothetical protein L6R48_18240 [Planctomycetes bacterium]|nr:hypothetical protein [Planctomycetota bacterium]
MPTCRLLCLLLPALLAALELPTDAQLDPALTIAGRGELRALAGLPRLGIEARVEMADGQVRRLAGHQRLRWTNPGPGARSDLCLRLIPNGEPFKGASLAIANLSVDGQPASSRMESAGTALLVDLPRPLAPGAAVEVACAFTCTPSAQGHHGLCRSSTAGATFYYWHPEPAGMVDGRWITAIPQDYGDASATTSFHAQVQLDLPPGLAAVTGGSAVSAPLPDGGSRLTIAAPFTRNLCLVLDPGWQHQDRTVDGTTVRAWVGPDDAAPGTRMVEAAAGSLQRFAAAFGSYPWSELDVVVAPLGDGAGGMESTGLVVIDGSLVRMARYVPPGDGPDTFPAFMLESVTAHEVAHEWWYSLVGSDAVSEPWVDESLTNWTGSWYLEQRGTPTPYGLVLMEFMISGRPLGAMDRPLAAFRTQEEYGGIVYARGALAWQALRREVGDQAFLGLLAEWQRRHRHQVADGTALRTLIGERLGPAVAERFATRWIDGTGLTMAEVSKAAAGGPLRP